MTILVTGFAPYKEPLNASERLVSSLASDLPEALAPLRERLVFEIIACDDRSIDSEHVSLEAALHALLARHDPAVCVFTGQAPQRDGISIERVGLNLFRERRIDPQGPVGYWANLPGIEQLPEWLNARQIPAAHSYYAGQHLCNHILYSCLHQAARADRALRAGFIHIPILPEQVDGGRMQNRGSPCMTTETARAALALLLRRIADVPPE